MKKFISKKKLKQQLEEQKHETMKFKSDRKKQARINLKCMKKK